MYFLALTFYHLNFVRLSINTLTMDCNFVIFAYIIFEMFSCTSLRVNVKQNEGLYIWCSDISVIIINYYYFNNIFFMVQ
jgi:hypothetical protein